MFISSTPPDMNKAKKKQLIIILMILKNLYILYTSKQASCVMRNATILSQLLR